MTPQGSFEESIAVASIGHQQFDPNATSEERQEATDGFFGSSIWILILVPLFAAILIAAIKRKRTPELRHVTDLSFEIDVVENERPVVVHAYKAWSIGDRVIENQVVKLEAEAEGTLDVFWLDLDKNPGTIKKHHDRAIQKLAERASKEKDDR